MVRAAGPFLDVDINRPPAQKIEIPDAEIGPVGDGHRFRQSGPEVLRNVVENARHGVQRTHHARSRQDRASVPEMLPVPSERTIGRSAVAIAPWLPRGIVCDRFRLDELKDTKGATRASEGDALVRVHGGYPGVA